MLGRKGPVVMLHTPSAPFAIFSLVPGVIQSPKNPTSEAFGAATRNVTFPSLSPVLVFAAVTGVIQTLQYFTQAAVAASVASGTATTGGGISSTFGYPENSTLTYPLHLYVSGFRYYDMGYANALAVVLFVVAFGVTLVLLRRFRAFTGGAR